MVLMLLSCSINPDEFQNENRPAQCVLTSIHECNWRDSEKWSGGSEAVLKAWVACFKLLLQHRASPTTTCIRAHLVSHPEVDDPNSSEWLFELKQIGPGCDSLSYQNEHAVRDVITDVFDRWVPAEGAEFRRILDREILKQGLSQPRVKNMSEHP
jgi:hypothetical protein